MLYRTETQTPPARPTWRRLAVALAACGLLGITSLGCEESNVFRDHDPVADVEGERAEEAAEGRNEAAGTDPLSEELREQVAEERAELAADVEADPGELRDEPARTAAETLGEGESYE